MYIKLNLAGNLLVLSKDDLNFIIPDQVFDVNEKETRALEIKQRR